MMNIMAILDKIRLIIRKNWLKMILFCSIFVLGIIFRLSLIQSGFPSGDDPGAHLTFTKLIITNKGALPSVFPYHVWSESFKYPVGYHWFIAQLVILTNLSPLYTLWYTCWIISLFLPVATYILAKVLFNREEISLAAMFFSATSPVEIHLMSWGGYPQVIALLLLFLMVACSKKFVEKPSIPYGLSLLIMSSTLSLVHPMSFILGFFGLAIPFVLSEFLIDWLGSGASISRKKLYVMVCFFWLFGALFIPTMPWFSGISQSGDASMSWNAFALPFTQVIRWFSDPFLAASILVDLGQFRLVLSLVSIVLLFFSILKKEQKHGFLALYFSLIIFLFASQGFMLNIYLYHPGRFFYFMLPSLYLLLGVFLYALFNCFRRLVSYKKMFLVVPILVMLFVPVAQYPQNPAYVESHQTLNSATFNALNWLRENTPVTAVVLCEHSNSFWVQGIGERKTVEALLAPPSNPMYRNMSRDADFLLNSDEANFTIICNLIKEWNISYVFLTNKTSFGQMPNFQRFSYSNPFFTEEYHTKDSDTEAFVYRVNPNTEITQQWLGYSRNTEFFFNYEGTYRKLVFEKSNEASLGGFIGVYLRRSGFPGDLSVMVNNVEYSVHNNEVREDWTWVFIPLNAKILTNAEIIVTLRSNGDANNWYSVGVDESAFNNGSFYFDQAETSWKSTIGEYVATLVLFK